MSRGPDCQQCVANTWGWEHRRGCRVSRLKAYAKYCVFIAPITDRCFRRAIERSATAITMERSNKSAISTRVNAVAGRDSMDAGVIVAPWVTLITRNVSRATATRTVPFSRRMERWCNVMIVASVRVDRW